MIINTIKYYRKKRDLSQRQLAFLTGISQNTISDYENLKCMPKLDHAFILSEVLDVGLYALFRYDFEVMEKYMHEDN